MHVHTKRVIDANASLTASVASRLEHEIERVFIGQEKAVHDVLIAMLAGGHCLFIGPSGLGKSLMGSVVAQACGLPLTSVPCGPDSTGALLQPGDGVLVFDELARAQPGVRRPLLDYDVSRATVFATHNPHDTFAWPLVEAELDRFMLSTPFEYPTAEEERDLLRRTSKTGVVAANTVIDADELRRARDEVRDVPAASNIIEYATRLARSTRPVHDGEPDFVADLVASGAGPRAGQALLAAAQAHALIDGEAAVALDDIDAVAPSVLRHRLKLTDSARRQGLTADDVISRLLPIARRS